MKTRKQAIIDQTYCCAICGKPFAGGCTTYYHNRTQTALCSRQCTMLATLIATAVDQFGSPDAFIDRLAAFVAAAKLDEVQQ